MLRSTIGFLAEPASSFLDQGEITLNNTRQRRAQAYGLVSKDDLPFVVHLSVPDKFWVAITEVVGMPELRSDPRFQTRDNRHNNYAELDAIFKEVALSRTRAEWFELLASADVPHGPIHGIGSMFSDPQVGQLRMIHEIDMGDQRPLRQVGPPLAMAGTPLRVSPPAPRHGQHTAEVLREVGYSDADIIRFRDVGVI